MNEILMPNALLYADQRQLELGETLGSGKDGILLVAKRNAQPAKVAIKALRWPEAYERERNVYERLRGAGAVVILGSTSRSWLTRTKDFSVDEVRGCVEFAGHHEVTRIGANNPVDSGYRCHSKWRSRERKQGSQPILRTIPSGHLWFFPSKRLQPRTSRGLYAGFL